MLSTIRRWLKPARDAEPAVQAAPVAALPEAKRAFDDACFAVARGELAQAEASARRATDLQHDYVEAHLLLGQLCHGRGAYEDAADSYTLASCFAPRFAEPHLALAFLGLDRGDFRAALESATKVMELAPGEARAYNAAGAALLNLERLAEAREHFERALELDPGLILAHSNLGYLLFRDFEEFEEGRKHILKAQELAPDDKDVMVNWTMIMLRERPAEVVTQCDRLLDLDPTLDTVRLNRGLARLSLREFAAGWSDYEARKSVRCNYVRRDMPWPEWRGESLSGRGIYVHTEQGLGDEIMFASCLPEIAASARRCVVECSPKLVSLFRRSLGVEVVVKPREDGALAAIAGAGIDCYSALGSLPQFLRASPADFPRHTGYLHADPARVEHWRRRLAELPGTLKIGIAWRGGVPSTQRSIRSTSLEEWLPVLRVPGVDYVDLQHFECAQELEGLRAGHGITVHRWPECHADYDDTAALVSALDLVISVQTALVHLSGALGRPTWALISATPEWRYLAQGESMPWYPSVRLFRQTVLRDWCEPMDAVATRLLEQVHGRR